VLTDADGEMPSTTSRASACGHLFPVELRDPAVTQAGFDATKYDHLPLTDDEVQRVLPRRSELGMVAERM
jgi:hypothetical protein